ncbi:MAG: cupin domain-containing protein [Cyanobacteria bacterium P01_D01_bin.123]
MPYIHQIDQIAPTLVPLDLHQPLSLERLGESFSELGSVDKGSASVGTWFGQTPWENHAGDEFLYVLDGEVSITLLRNDTPEDYRLVPGSVFIVPAQVWHRSHAEQPVTMLAVLASPHGPVSYAGDPRKDTELKEFDWETVDEKTVS